MAKWFIVIILLISFCCILIIGCDEEGCKDECYDELQNCSGGDAQGNAACGHEYDDCMDICESGCGI